MRKECPAHQNSPYWDQQANQFAADHFQETIAQYKKREHLEMILSWYQSDQGARILKTDLFEEAHGRDSFIPELETRFNNIVAIDISAEVVRRARSHFPGHNFFVSDVASLALPTNHFDLIISTSTLDHLIPERFESALDELNRVLKPGGCLIITLDNKHNPLHRLSHWLRKLWGWYYIDRCFALRPTSQMLTRHGFRITAHTAIYHVPFLVNLITKKVQPRLGSGGNRMLRAAIAGFGSLNRLPSRFFTGRYLALRAVKADDHEKSF